MSKRTLITVMLVTLCVSLFAGGAVNLMVLNSLDDDVVKVDLKEGEPAVIEFNDLDLIPGDRIEYVLKVADQIDGAFDLELAFNENSDSPLKNYIYAKVEADGEELCNVMLAELLDSDKTFSLYCENDGKGAYDIKITYYMLPDVGNEAMEAEADFDLTLTAKNS